MSLSDLRIARILTFFSIFVYYFVASLCFSVFVVSWFGASVVSYLYGFSDSSASLSSQPVYLFLCLFLHFPRRPVFFSPLASSLALDLIVGLRPRSRPSSSGFGFLAFGLIRGLRPPRSPSASPSGSVLGLQSRHRPNPCPSDSFSAIALGLRPHPWSSVSALTFGLALGLRPRPQVSPSAFGLGLTP